MMPGETHERLGRESAANLSATSSVGAAPPAWAAWELVDAGRYMPRRIRGSCLGRELG
jgi:hypothetical protein